jgi:hypothetical protein
LLHEQAEWLGRLHRSLMGLPQSSPFNQPVAAADAVSLGYHDVILRPLDLGTIRLALDQHKYPNISSYIADVHLVFNNALLFVGVVLNLFLRLLI